MDGVYIPPPIAPMTAEEIVFLREYEAAEAIVVRVRTMLLSANAEEHERQDLRALLAAAEERFALLQTTARRMAERRRLREGRIS